jgi:hypothetical protein
VLSMNLQCNADGVWNIPWLSLLASLQILKWSQFMHKISLSQCGHFHACPHEDTRVIRHGGDTQRPSPRGERVLHLEFCSQLAVSALIWGRSALSRLRSCAKPSLVTFLQTGFKTHQRMAHLYWVCSFLNMKEANSSQLRNTGQLGAWNWVFELTQARTPVWLHGACWVSVIRLRSGMWSYLN